MDNQKLDLNSPLREGPAALLPTHFLAWSDVQRLITSPDMKGWTDPRIEMAVRHHVSLIPGEEIRRNVLEQFEKEIVTNVKQSDSNENKGRAMFLACMELEGALSSYFDEYIGQSHKLAVGIATPPIPEVMASDQLDEADPIPE